MNTYLQDIATLIAYIRGEKVILDFHLAALYGVPTKSPKQAVRRNIDRFPSDFMFELSADEWTSLRSQIVTLEKSGKGEHPKYAPFAFTEQGIAMLSSVLKSKQAIDVNINIMRAFVQMRRMLEENKEQRKKIEALEAKYDKQFAIVFEAIKKLIHQENTPRTPIGFRIKTDQT